MSRKRAVHFNEYYENKTCISVNIYEKKKNIVSNTKHIENKSYTALESKYSYRSSQMLLHLMDERHFRLLKSTAHQKRIL